MLTSSQATYPAVMAAVTTVSTAMYGVRRIRSLSAATQVTRNDTTARAASQISEPTHGTGEMGTGTIPTSLCRFQSYRGAMDLFRSQAKVSSACDVRPFARGGTGMDCTVAGGLISIRSPYNLHTIFTLPVIMLAFLYAAG
jgi:hypothetical protein